MKTVLKIPTLAILIYCLTAFLNADEKMIGTYKGFTRFCNASCRHHVLKLKADHSYAFQSYHKKISKKITKGTWEMEGNLLVLKPENYDEDSEMDLSMRFLSIHEELWYYDSDLKPIELAMKRIKS